MSYVLPRDLSQKFGISLQTVYNYLSKFEGKIRTRKDY
jgi:predicted DNA binding protein